ncbi:MAG: hypothetical protein IT385_11625 [Deltaproteobacteria bacterium]|nr:hypothetical protein [Deltaproteobacteria bacterium]
MTPFEPLLGLPAKGLAEVMQEALAQGESDAGDLCADGRGWLWHGLALATPEPLFRLVGKFGKAFEPDPETGGATLRGWNVRMRQRKDERWEPLTIRDRQVTYGRYRLDPAPAGPEAPHPGALLIDYGGGANRPWDPLGLVRDYIVMLEPGLWLGHMYVELGLPGPLARVLAPRTIATPSWFALARGAPLPG